MNRDVFNGGIFVALGASSYGILATFVKLAYLDGFNTAEVTFSQFVIGGIILFLLLLFQNKTDNGYQVLRGRNIFKLILGGTSIGLTSIFFYSSVKLIPVGLSIVLLMQSIWMSVFFESVLERRFPDLIKLISTAVVLFGTYLAVGVINTGENLNVTGFVYGILSALSYTVCMYASNNIELHLSSTLRSFLLVMGGLIAVVLYMLLDYTTPFSWSIFLTWGPVVALFGTVIPPLLFTRGMPLTGMGLGAIIAAIELPVSIVFAYFVLGETVTLFQSFGVGLIIFAVIIMNYRVRSS